MNDTTISEPVINHASRIQESVNEIVTRPNENKLQLNEKKCEEMRISFAKSPAVFFILITEMNNNFVEIVAQTV